MPVRIPLARVFGSNEMARAVHEFYQERGFLYLHTPIITATDCEAAGAMFRVTTLDPAHPPLTSEGSVDFSQDFFGKEAHLTVSGQLAAETAALAFCAFIPSVRRFVRRIPIRHVTSPNSG